MPRPTCASESSFEDYIQAQLEQVTQHLQNEYRRLHSDSNHLAAQPPQPPRTSRTSGNDSLLSAMASAPTQPPRSSGNESILSAMAAATQRPLPTDQGPGQEVPASASLGSMLGRRLAGESERPSSPQKRMTTSSSGSGQEYLRLPSPIAERGKPFLGRIRSTGLEGVDTPCTPCTPSHFLQASNSMRNFKSVLSPAASQDIARNISAGSWAAPWRGFVEYGSGSPSIRSSRSNAFHRSDTLNTFNIENDRSKCCWEQWTVHPNHIFYRAWSLFITCLVMVNCFFTPLHFAFRDDFKHADVVETCMDLFFLIDILLTFNVAYVTKTELHTSRCHIAYHYLKSRRFWIALVATVPFDNLYFKVFTTKRANTHLGAMLGLLRLLRINRLIILFGELQKNTSFNLLGVVVAKFFLFILLCTHTSGCSFYALARINNFDETTWVPSFSEHLPESHLITRYVHVLFWAVGTFKAGPSHSSISPTSNSEMVLAISTMMVNICLQTYLVSNMAALLTRSDARTYAFRKEVGQLHDFSSRHSLPRELRDQLKAYLAFKFRTNQDMDQNMLLSFPELYRQRISHQLYEHIVAQIELFDGCQQRFLFQLHSSLTATLHMPLQYLAVIDEPCTSLQMLAEGWVEMLINGQSVDFCRVGQSFSAVPFLCQVGYTLSVQTCKFCRVLSLDHVPWNNACSAYPENLNQVKVNLLQDCIKKSHTFEEDSLGQIVYAEFASIVEANLTQQREMGIALMISAAARGDANELKRLLVGLSPNCANSDSRTPLHAAAASGQVDSIHLLLEQSAHIDPIDIFGRTPLLEACRMHHEEAASQLFLHGADVGGAQKRQFGTGENQDLAGYLPPEMGYDASERWVINAVSDELCKAAASKDMAWYLKALLRYRADPNQCDQDMRTPLHVACASNNTVAVKIFAANPKIELSSMDHVGQTPLVVAVRLGHDECAAILKERGASHGYCLDVRARKSPFQISANQELCNAVCANELALLQRLIHYCGLPVDAPDLDHRTALMVACAMGNMDAAIILVQNGADIDLRDSNGTTSVMEAQKRHQTQLVAVLRGTHKQRVAGGGSSAN